MVWIP